MKNDYNIAILMSTYNGESFISEQIDSILNQSYKNFKLFIRDDCSSDNTREIINQYMQNFPDKIEFINSNINLGAAQSFLYLIQYISNDSNVKFVMFSDQDDIWLENKIEDSVKFIQSYNNDKPLLCHTDLKVVDRDLNIINPSFVKMRCLQPNITSLNKLLIQNNITGCTMIFNKNLLNIISKNIVQNIAMHDWWITLISSAFGEIHFLNKQTILYRQHGNNVIGATNVKSISFIFRRLFQYNHIKKTLQLSIVQAEQFYYCFKQNLNAKQLFIIKQFLSLKNLSKVQKWKVILHNDFLKQGLIQIIGELLFI